MRPMIHEFNKSAKTCRSPQKAFWPLVYHLRQVFLLRGLTMSKRIPLTQGKFAIVDDEDYEWLSKYKWCLFTKKNHNLQYAYRSSKQNGKRVAIFMHRLILGLSAGDGKMTDHKNRNGLDNHRINLRVCTNRLNQGNSKIRKDNTSGFKGVVWHKQARKWMSEICHKGTLIYLGLFENKLDAALAYDEKARELFGKFARTNF